MMENKIEHVEEGREKDHLNIKCRQISKMLEDVDYILIASDEEGQVASANYDTTEDLIHMLMGFAIRHEPMLKALVTISKIIDKAINDTDIQKIMLKYNVDPDNFN